MAPDSRRRVLKLAAGLLAAVLIFGLTFPLPPRQRVMAAVFVLAIFYWVTEPLPLFVTAVIAVFAAALCLGPLAPFFGEEPIKPDVFFAPFASSVVVLMFGGFVMARVFSKNNLDLELCRAVLGRLGSRPQVVLLGVMVITAVMSMWMSNTATTAIMVAAVLPLLRSFPMNSNVSKAFILAVPFAANIGGIATPIGTPPNAVAIGLAASAGQRISFVAWMLAGLPFMLVSLALAYGLILVFFPVRGLTMEVELGVRPVTGSRKLIYATLGATILLWLTDALHHIPAALVGLLPVVVFSIAGLVDKAELRDLSWDILLLIGGGLSLGVGLEQTGLAAALVEGLVPAGLPPVALRLLLCSLVALLATFMSHTASASIILPLALSLQHSLPAPMLISVGICASYGMALPVSTPPNAIAFSSDLLHVRDMVKVGVLITILGVLLTALGSGLIFNLWPALYGIGR